MSDFTIKHNAVVGEWRKNVFPTPAFWYCTAIGWSIYSVLDALETYLHNHEFLEQLAHSFLTAGLGILFGVAYRQAAYYFRLHYQHPVKCIPLSVILAILAGYCFTLVDYVLLRGNSVLDFLVGLALRPADYWWFPFAISHWIGTSYTLLIWLLLFNYIQAERQNAPIQKATLMHWFVAIAALYFFNEFFHVLVVIAYYNPEGFLFSADFFRNNFYILLTCSLCALLVFLFKVPAPVLGSQLVASLAGLGFLVFCASFFGMLVYRLLFSMASLEQLPLVDLPKAIAAIFTGVGPLWSNKNEFIGTLRSQLNLQAVTVVVFFYLRYPTGHLIQQLPSAKLDFKTLLQFWAYNISGWSVLGGYLYFADLLSWQSVSNEFARTMLLGLIISGAFVGLLMRALIRRFLLLEKTLAGFSLAIFLFSLSFGLLLSGSLWLIGYSIVLASDNMIQLQAYESLVKGGDFFIPLIAVASAGCWMWVMVYEKSVVQRKKAIEQFTQLQLEKNLKELQLNQLAGKVDPHFIFNALNNIRALIREDTEKAREAILVLSNILRMPLASNATKISLRDELDLVRNYIHLCKIQFEDRLRYVEQIDPAVIQAFIPPMCLQIMVENAIKHGISQLPDGGELELKVSANEGELWCDLTNSGCLQIAEANEGFGVGLNSIRERLKLLYGETANFSLQENNLHVSARLRLPLEYAI